MLWASSKKKCILVSRPQRLTKNSDLWVNLWEGPEHRTSAIHELPVILYMLRVRSPSWWTPVRVKSDKSDWLILVSRGRAPFGQHQESRPLARSSDISVLNGFCKLNRLRPEPIRFVRLDCEHAQSEREVPELRTSGFGPGQRSWFLVLTKRSAASGDENVIGKLLCASTSFPGCFPRPQVRERDLPQRSQFLVPSKLTGGLSNTHNLIQFENSPFRSVLFVRSC